MAKFEALALKRVSLYDRLNFQKIQRISIGNFAGEQSLALQQLFPYKSSYVLKNPDRHKISMVS